MKLNLNKLYFGSEKTKAELKKNFKYNTILRILWLLRSPDMNPKDIQ